MSHIPSFDSMTNMDWNFNSSRNSVFTFGNEATHDSGSLFLVAPQSKLEARLKTINTELASMGYPNILLMEDGQLNVVINVLIQNMLRLLDSYFKSLAAKSELDSRLRRVEGDLAQVQKMYRRCQDNLTESQNIIAMAKEKERRLEAEKKALNGRLKTNTDELRKLQLNLQRHETQAAHERRKLERENVALRERLNSSFSRPASNPKLNQQGAAQRRRTTVSSGGLSGSLISLNADWDASEGAPRRPAAQMPRTITKSPSLNRVSSRATKASNFSSTGPISRNGESKVTRPWTVYDTASSAANEGGSQADLYALIVQQLEERQNTLLYENRELRDVVCQLSTRIVRFSGFVEHLKLPTTGVKPKPSSSPTEEDVFDSLDEESDGEQLLPLTRESSDNDDEVIGNNKIVTRRKSANVNELLLQLPYALVRDHLMQRVRQLSRKLWRQLKALEVQSQPKELSSPIAVQSEPEGTVLATPPDPTSPNKLTDAVFLSGEAVTREDLQNEITNLKRTISKYELRIQEQDVALRHALFSGSRRWNGLGYSDSFVEQDAKGNLADPFHRRTELFKLASTTHLFPKDRLDSSYTTPSKAPTLPRNGSGDAAESPKATQNMVDKTFRLPLDAPDSKSASPIRPVVIERAVVDLNQHDYSSETSRTTAAHSTFTSSPFPGRARALSIVND